MCLLKIEKFKKRNEQDYRTAYIVACPAGMNEREDEKYSFTFFLMRGCAAWLFFEYRRFFTQNIRH